MSSSWTSDLASLDGSLSSAWESLEELKAVQIVDVVAVLNQLKTAVAVGQKLRSTVADVLPEASWHNRQELEAVLARAARIGRRRSRLLELATVLESADIVHRRAHRVEHLNQLRAQAITELRSQATSGKEPPNLPGPDAEKWVDWACSLKEPEDSAALQALRLGFAHLDDFVTDLEPGMWLSKARSEILLCNGPELKSLITEVREQLRSRLLTLAAELEQGHIVHHRAARFNQLNQLREQAIKELRSQANAEGEPPSLPGPATAQWIQWACGLKESQDAEALQMLRSGFAHLDGFISNLEPHMWIGGGAKPDEAEAEPEDSPSYDCRPKLQAAGTWREGLDSLLPEPVLPPGVEPSETQRLEPQRLMTTLAAFASQALPGQQTGPAPSAATSSQQVGGTLANEPALEHSLSERAQKQVSNLSEQVRQRDKNFVTLEHPIEGSDSERFPAALWARVQKVSWMKHRVPLAIATGLLFITVVIGFWGLHTVHAKATVPIASTTSLAASGTLENKVPDQPGAAADSKTITGSSTPHNVMPFRPEDSSNATKQVEARESAVEASKDTTGSAVAPVIVLPNDAAGSRKGKTTADGGMLEAPPPSLQAGMPNNLTGILTNAPVSVPKLAAEQPVRLSSGSAQEAVVSLVRPVYPAPAREMRIQGTVVVQAVIGKDGKIVRLHATSGHPLLIQAALDAVKQSQFRPYLLNGVPVEADTRINVNFVIKGN